jgi:hypothetical protein
MRIQKQTVIALTGLALMLTPTASTVGVTGADNLISSKTAIIQGVPLKSSPDRDLMASIDNQISLAVTAQR